MHSLINKIQSKIKSNILLDYDMRKSTWFRAGGNALGYVIVNSISDLKTIISYSDQIKYYIVGVGSNLMVRDGGFEGLIIKLGKNFNKIKINKDTLSVGAGVLDINLAKFALQNSIKDFEFFSGIPGTIGGAIKMNAGCYGHVKNRIDSFLGNADTYQIDLSLMAFKSGGIFGKGPGQGDLKEKIPDANTDFIFAVAGEELGFIFCSIIILLILTIIIRLLLKLLKMQDPYIIISIVGLTCCFGLQSLINIFSSLSIIPTKGMTLPYIR